MTEPIENKEFAGYFEIPEFSKYIISKEGNVIQKITKHIIKPYISADKYVKYSLVNDIDKRVCIGRHRLLCIVFKPNKDYKSLEVNHINAIPGDDRLENLEWCTHIENIHHAVKLGLYDKSRIRKVCVRDARLGVEAIYESVSDCARSLNLSCEAVRYRLEKNDFRVYPEGKQYKYFDDETAWKTFMNLDYELMKNGTSRSILVKNLETTEIQVFEKLSDLAKFFNITLSTLSTWLFKQDQPVVYCKYLLKLASDTNPWRIVDDVYIETAKTYGTVPVRVYNVETKQSTIYSSTASCARAHNISITSLNYRLKYANNIVFSNKYIFSYYTNSVQYIREDV